ncbi:MAG: DNA polymerase II large subunit [Promethearchaeota archaeon]
MDFDSEYSTYLRDELRRLEAVAQAARRKGLDPCREVEVRPADDVAGRVEGLIGPPGVANRIRELAEEMTPQEIAFQVAREIVHKAIDEVQDVEVALDQAIRTALAILTEGITAGPIEGIAQVKIKKNSDGSEYLAVYFAGPIRAAGGTEAALIVVVADDVRRVLGLDRYKPTRDIIERYVEEVALYKRVSHLQYPSTSEEVRLAAQNLPVEVTGEPTLEAEVSGYRDLPGVETNRIRTGAILVLNDSILGKAHKVAKEVKRLKLPGWDWIERRTPQKSVKTESSQTVKPNDKFLEDIIAGRPVLAYPSRKGGFRIRYGRARNTGLAALGVHPATMVLLDNFVACGTQLIVERPGKAGVAMPVDSIHGPIVKLYDGSIKRVDSVAEAKNLRSKLARILFLGDLLIAFGEFRENNHLLVPAGYCPEWWIQEVKRALLEISPSQKEELEKKVDPKRLTKLFQDPLYQYPDPWQALAISSILSIPLHPRYTYFWEDITHEQLIFFQRWVQSLTVEHDESHVNRLIGELTPEIEAILDELCIPFEKEEAAAVFHEAAPILHSMFVGEKQCPIVNVEDEKSDALSIIQKHWYIPIKQKGTFFVGARIGRPEKAKRREMKVPVHGLFPVGMAGGPTRDIIKAEKKGKVDVETTLRKCPKCGEIDMFLTCMSCGVETVSVSWCPTCQEFRTEPTCSKCQEPTTSYGPTTLNLRKQLQRVRRLVGARLPSRVKGVKGLMSKHKISEIPEKAVLRARHDLYVYKDGTIRFDMTDAPLTHFTPKEIDVTVDKLLELGYNADIQGKPLTREDQILELKPQDIVVPRNCANYLYRISHFIDELLTDLYELDAYYKLKSPEDILGHLVIGLAPHTSAGIIARVIGFTPLRVCYAHPFWHAAKRRNADGDEDSILLALDALINFSREFLPARRGGTMDTPLVLSVSLTPAEVDDEAHNMDVGGIYPLEFYERAKFFVEPRGVENVLDIVEQRLGSDAECRGFLYSHPTRDANYGPPVTLYTKLKTMEEKVDRQLALGRRIAAVDVRDMVTRLLKSHFLPDIFGNIRAYTSQKFRCTSCNAKFRRIPLVGVCTKCGGKLVLTVTKSGITKYISLARRIAEEYDLPKYYRQRLELAQDAIDSLFASEEPDRQQTRLGDFTEKQGSELS